MMTELQIVEKYLKVPYKSEGKDMNGMNCWELVKSVYRDLGKPLEDLVEYAEKCPIGEQARLAESYKDSVVKVSSPQSFDIVLMEFDGNLHAGIVLSKFRFLHTCRSGTGVCRLNDHFWWKRILGYYRAR